MPNLGEIRRGNEIGYQYKDAWHIKYIYEACPLCGKPRWIGLGYHSKEMVCKSCAAKRRYGPNSNSWKGGGKLSGNYIITYIPETDSLYSMTMKGQKGHVREHRLMMARHLGRCLEDYEVVHHINGILSDNRLDNLELEIRNNHVKHHHQLGSYPQSRKKIDKKKIIWLAKEGISYYKIAKELGIDWSTAKKYAREGK